MAFQQAYNSREKPVTKALLHPPDDRSVCPPPPLSPVGMDKGGIQIDLGRGYLPRCERSYRLEHPAHRQIAWALQQYRELGYELDKNYHYERVLSVRG
ncbi:hypothetical protein V8E54_011926 [Elaphomyces granulatus]